MAFIQIQTVKLLSRRSSSHYSLSFQTKLVLLQEHDLHSTNVNVPNHLKRPRENTSCSTEHKRLNDFFSFIWTPISFLHRSPSDSLQRATGTDDGIHLHKHLNCLISQTNQSPLSEMEQQPPRPSDGSRFLPPTGAQIRRNTDNICYYRSQLQRRHI